VAVSTKLKIPSSMCSERFFRLAQSPASGRARGIHEITALSPPGQRR
jgi:hypothetical protein